MKAFEFSKTSWGRYQQVHNVTIYADTEEEAYQQLEDDVEWEEVYIDCDFEDSDISIEHERDLTPKEVKLHGKKSL